MMDKNYKNIIFTNHARERLGKRSISINDVWKTINYPSQKKLKKEDTTKFIKLINGRKIHAIATFLKKEKKWLVVSVWVRGETDQLPLFWQIITLPFKIIWWLIKQIASKIIKL